MSRDPFFVIKNAGPTELRADVAYAGRDVLVTIFGGERHVGAVGVGGYSVRAYASVLTMSGHRDDVIAKEAALRISKALKCSCVVIVGVHVDDASGRQISEMVDTSFALVEELIEALK